jgi:predicted phage tail protein
MDVRTLTLTKIHHPFNRVDRDDFAYEYRGEPLTVIRTTLPADVAFVISLNGQMVPDEHLALVIPQPGDHVVFRPIPAGSGESGKAIGRMVGMLIVAGLAMATGGGAFGMMPAFWGMSAASVTMLAGAAVGMVGGLLVGAVFAPKSPTLPALGATSNAYSWTPQTLQQQGLPIPKWYGTNKLTGNVISGFIDKNGPNQYLNLLISLGMGPFADISSSEMYVGDQPYSYYANLFVVHTGGSGYKVNDVLTVVVTGVSGATVTVTAIDSGGAVTGVSLLSGGQDYPVISNAATTGGSGSGCTIDVRLAEPEVRTGLLRQAHITGFEAINIDHNQMTKIEVGTPYTYVTPNSQFDELQIELSCPQGLVYYNAKGVKFPVSVGYLVEIQQVGTSTWVTLNQQYMWGHLIVYTYSQMIVGNDAHNYSQVIAATNLDHGQYRVRVTRVFSYFADRDWFTPPLDSCFSDLYLTNVREVTYSSLTYPRQVLVGIKALASSSISGSFQFSRVGDCSLIRVWDGTAWSVIFSNSPAWALWDVLTQPVFDNSLNVLRYDGIDPARLDLPKWKELADWNAALVPDGNGGTEPRMTFNGGFDAGTSLWDCALQICQIAGCSLIPTGTGYTLAIEKPSDPVGLFSVGNIGQGSFKETFLPMEDRAAEIQVDYMDRDQNYARTQINVVNPDIKTVANKVSVQALGVTKASEAWRLATRQLKVNQLIIRTIEITADIDAIACTVGDVTNVQHDVPQWGFGGRIMAATSTTVQLDQQVTLVAGTGYSIMVRLSDDTLVTRTVVTGAGTTDTLTVSTPFSSVPAQFDVFAFGVTGLVVKPFRVIGIQRSGELQATITAVEYNASIYDDSGAPSLPTVNYSALATYVEISGLTLLEHASVIEGGTLQRNIDVSWSTGGAVQLRNEIFLREPGLPWQQVGTTPDTAYTIRSVRPDTVYDVMVIGVNSAGLSTPSYLSPVESITTSSTTDAVGTIGVVAVTGLQVSGGGESFTGRDCSLVWDAPALPGTVDHYLVQILSGSTVKRSESVFVPAYVYSYGKNFDDNGGAPLAAFTVQVTAVDIGGGQSAVSSLAVTNSAPAAPSAIAGSGQLMAIQLAVTYVATEDFDCLEVWASATNDRSTAALAGTTKTASFTHSGLGTNVSRYYWVRVRDLFGQESGWYPSSSTAGFHGVTLADPSTVMALLHQAVSIDELNAVLQALFRIGMIGGVSTLGVDGNMVVDGSLLARAIATDQLVVGDNVTMGPAATIDWSAVNGKPNVTHIDSDGIYTGTLTVEQIILSGDVVTIPLNLTIPDQNLPAGVGLIYSHSYTLDSRLIGRPHFVNLFMNVSKDCYGEVDILIGSTQIKGMAWNAIGSTSRFVNISGAFTPTAAGTLTINLYACGFGATDCATFNGNIYVSASTR